MTGWENDQRVPVAYHPYADGGDDPEEDDDLEYLASAPLVMARNLVGAFLGEENRALFADCMGIVTGIGIVDQSLEAVAKRHNVTRAAISKRCIDLCRRFGIPPNHLMRPEQAREHCRDARKSVLLRA
jgi:hypothetical protein